MHYLILINHFTSFITFRYSTRVSSLCDARTILVWSSGRAAEHGSRSLLKFFEGNTRQSYVNRRVRFSPSTTSPPTSLARPTTRTAATTPHSLRPRARFSSLLSISLSWCTRSPPHTSIKDFSVTHHSQHGSTRGSRGRAFPAPSSWSR